MSKEDIVLYCQKHILIDIMSVVISSLTDKVETSSNEKIRKDWPLKQREAREK